MNILKYTLPIFSMHTNTHMQFLNKIRNMILILISSIFLSENFLVVFSVFKTGSLCYVALAALELACQPEIHLSLV